MENVIKMIDAFLTGSLYGLAVGFWIVNIGTFCKWAFRKIKGKFHKETTEE